MTDHLEEGNADDRAAGVCRACGLETRAPEDGLCEFCAFLRTWFTGNKIDAVATGKLYGAAKVVRPDGTLVAYVPFREDDDLTRHLADGSTVALWHGMVFEVAPGGDDTTPRLGKLLESGKLGHYLDTIRVAYTMTTDAKAPLASVNAKLDGRPTGVIAVRREDAWEPLFVFVDAELLKRLEYV